MAYTILDDKFSNIFLFEVVYKRLFHTQTENSLVKMKLAYTHKTDNFAFNCSWVYMIRL